MKTIWFNDNLSSISEVIGAVLSSGILKESIIVTSKNKFFAGFDLVSKRLVEAPAADPAEYVEWALDFAADNKVTHFFVGRFVLDILKREKSFNDIGVTLMTSVSLSTWDMIDDKANFYRHLEATGNSDMLPAWTTWSDDNNEDISKPVSLIKTSGHGVEACVKPVRGIFGQGYFLFNESPDPAQQIFYPDDKVIKPSTFADLAKSFNEKEGKTRSWMVLEYLPGSEFSVDALAHQGELVAFIARKKNDTNSEGQTIVDHPEIARQMGILAKEFSLSGAFNAQFKLSHKDEIKVLEINPRFSGGIGISLMAGINTPALWLDIINTGSTASLSVPKANYGMHIYTKPKAVEITDHSESSI